MEAIANFFGPLWPLVWALAKIVMVLVPLMVAVAYMTYAERRIIGFMQMRPGPNRCGPLGLLQPIADAMKLVFKEVIMPSRVNKVLYFVGPILALAPALVAWSVIPFGDGIVISNANAGVLLLLAITSIEVYGVIVAGWASNSKYAFIGIMRAAAQMISYEVAMSFALICVLLLGGSLNITDIVNSQGKGYFSNMGLTFLSWNWLILLPVFVVFMISSVAETNRAPFDVVEGESEIVAGHMIEFSGMTFALFFLAEYANMVLVSALVSLFFLGGWLSPVGFLPDSMLWFFLKIAFFLFCFLWLRATFPRFRYDQVMRLGWKVFVPITLVWLIVIAVWMIATGYTV